MKGKKHQATLFLQVKHLRFIITRLLQACRFPLPSFLQFDHMTAPLPPIRVPHHLSNASCYTHVHKVFFVSSPIKLGIKKNIIQSDCGALSLSAFLHHLCEAVGDAEGGVNESLHAAHQARLCPVVQL